MNLMNRGSWMSHSAYRHFVLFDPLRLGVISLLRNAMEVWALLLPFNFAVLYFSLQRPAWPSKLHDLLDTWVFSLMCVPHS